MGKIGNIAFLLRGLSLFLMAVSAIATVISIIDVMNALAMPGGASIPVTMNLAAVASFVLVFLAAGMLWVLTDILQQAVILASPAPVALQEVTHAENHG
jgi:hypothetical protein